MEYSSGLESPLEVVKPGSLILVLSPYSSQNTECIRNIFEEGDNSEKRLGIFTQKSPEYSMFDTNFDIIHCTPSKTSSPKEYDSVDVRDLTQIGIQTTKWFRSNLRDGGKSRLLIDSISLFEQYHDESKLFRFLHVFGGAVSNRGSVAIVNYDFNTEERKQNIYKQLFDYVIEVNEDNQYKISGSGVSTDWITPSNMRKREEDGYSESEEETGANNIRESDESEENRTNEEPVDVIEETSKRIIFENKLDVCINLDDTEKLNNISRILEVPSNNIERKDALESATVGLYRGDELVLQSSVSDIIEWSMNKDSTNIFDTPVVVQNLLPVRDIFSDLSLKEVIQKSQKIEKLPDSMSEGVIYSTIREESEFKNTQRKKYYNRIAQNQDIKLNIAGKGSYSKQTSFHVKRIPYNHHFNDYYMVAVHSNEYDISRGLFCEENDDGLYDGIITTNEKTVLNMIQFFEQHTPG